MYLFPAGHGKSSLISKVAPIYQLCKNPNIKIKLICYKAEDAERWGADIIRELEDNEELIRDFGEFKPDFRKAKWTPRSFSVKQRTKWSKDDNFEAYGWEGYRPGKRADLVIMDDVVEKENAESVKQTAKLTDWFDSIVMRSMDDPVNFKVWVVGTVYNYGDLYHVLMDRAEIDDRWKIFVRDVFISEEKQLVLWPERVPYELLAKDREVNPVAFDKRMRNRCYPEEMYSFPEDILRNCRDTQRTHGHMEETWYTALGFDPTAARKKRGSFAAMVVGGYDPQTPEKRYVIDIWNGKLSIEGQATTIVDAYVKYKCKVAVIEKNIGQYGLIEMVENIARDRGININIRPHYTGSNKTDEDIGVESLRKPLGEQLYSLPFADDTETQRRTLKLHEELRTWPVGKTTDLVMAFWFLDLELRRSVAKLRSGYEDAPRVMAVDRDYIDNPAWN